MLLRNAPSPEQLHKNYGRREAKFQPQNDPYPMSYCLYFSLIIMSVYKIEPLLQCLNNILEI